MLLLLVPLFPAWEEGPRRGGAGWAEVARAFVVIRRGLYAPHPSVLHLGHRRGVPWGRGGREKGERRERDGREKQDREQGEDVGLVAVGLLDWMHMFMYITVRYCQC